MDYKVNQKEACDKYLIQYNENNDEGSYIIGNYNKYKKFSQFNDIDINCYSKNNNYDNMHMSGNKFNSKEGTSIIGNVYQKYNVHVDKNNEFENTKKGSYLLRNDIYYKYNKTNCYEIENKQNENINYTNMDQNKSKKKNVY